MRMERATLCGWAARSNDQCDVDIDALHLTSPSRSPLAHMRTSLCRPPSLARSSSTRRQSLRCCASCSRRLLLAGVSSFSLFRAPSSVAEATDALSELPFDELEQRARAFYYRRELEDSLDALTELTRREPTTAVWRERRAQVLLDLKRFEDAIAEFETATRLQPADYVSLGLLSNRALAYEGLGRYAEADADYSRSIELSASLGATQPYVLNSRGNVRAALGRYEAALADYTAASASFRKIRNLNGVSYADSNAALVAVQLDLPGASERVDTAARRAPGSVDMRIAQAAIAWHAGQQAKAESLFEFACSQIYQGQVLEGEEGRGGPVLDSCLLYRDDSWVRNVRRWPPKLADWLSDFLALRATSTPS